MNREITIEAIKVMQAWVDGKEVECAEIGRAQWTPIFTPVWNWNNYIYRIKPTPKHRPWIADEVPLGAWLRYKKMVGDRWMVTNVGSDSVRVQWLIECEHSTDCGKTWKPCGVEEVQ